jgi:hypothetical protein
MNTFTDVGIKYTSKSVEVAIWAESVIIQI